MQLWIKRILLDSVHEFNAEAVIGNVTLRKHVLKPLQHVKERFLLIIPPHIIIINNWLYFILLNRLLRYILYMFPHTLKVLIQLVKRFSDPHILCLLPQTVQLIQVELRCPRELCIVSLVFSRCHFYHAHCITDHSAYNFN